MTKKKLNTEEERAKRLAEWKEVLEDSAYKIVSKKSVIVKNIALAISTIVFVTAVILFLVLVDNGKFQDNVVVTPPTIEQNITNVDASSHIYEIDVPTTNDVTIQLSLDLNQLECLTFSNSNSTGA